MYTEHEPYINMQLQYHEKVNTPQSVFLLLLCVPCEQNGNVNTAFVAL